MPGAIAGQVLLSGDRKRPAARATVVVEDAAGGTWRAETDAQGRFRVDALAAGTYAITVLGAGGEQGDLRTDVVAGTTSEVALRLAPTGGSETIEVRGLSEAGRRRQSADAVTVVDTERAKRETADLGEVLARTRGVSVRRAGGLGSGGRLSLAGLTEDQVRIFLDGLPLELSGYLFGIANVPVNLVERVEIYSGVVPVRFGTDALGGGINLVTDQRIDGTHGGASYEVGSFGTDRATLSARHASPAGIFTRVDGFFDRARNNYMVDVEVPDELGRLSPARVPLFHDGYVSAGGVAEAGVVDRWWAKRLVVRGFASGLTKEFQSNQTMERVYGDVTYRKRSGGGSVRYLQPLGAGVSLDAIAGYSFTRGRFRDVSPCVYDWYGDCFRESAPGEVGTMPHDQVTWEHAAFARANIGWTVRAGHALSLSVAPTYVTRDGNEHRDDLGAGSDPLSAERSLMTVVSGIEYQVDALGDRLENIAFAKHYYQRQVTEVLAGQSALGDRRTQRAGFGDGVRYRFRDWLYAKASYEWATRLPRPDEVFGDNAFVAANPLLVPESSHNLNLGVTVDDVHTSAGVLGASATGVLREIDRLISPLPSNEFVTYENVYGARSIGIEAAASWKSPGDYLAIDGAASYLEFRNNDSAGEFGAFKGDRIPDQPYLFASGSARVTLRELVLPRDQITLSFGSRYVHSFFRSWESIGLHDSKQTIPSQLVHSIGLGYLVRRGGVGFSTTIEVSNVTDEAVFDFYGLQRPGRALYVKTALDF